MPRTHDGINGVHMYPSGTLEHSLNTLAVRIHSENMRWWLDPATGEPIQRNFGEMMALVHSEISEALEADRKNLSSDKLDNRTGVEEELADAIIRIMDICGGLELNIGDAVAEKLKYNRQRADHKAENRLQDGGKRY